MASQPPDRAEVEEALFELQQYLSDRIAPLMVADSIELLTRVPADLVVAQIDAWTSGQYRSGRGGVPVSDYLFHAVQKIHMLGDFKLLPVSVLDPYVAQLKQAVLAICPEEDRELLASNLERLEHLGDRARAGRRHPVPPARRAAHGRVRTARRVGAHAGGRGRRSGAGERAAPGRARRSASAPMAAAPVDPVISADVAHSLRRLTLLLGRLATNAMPAGVEAAAPTEQNELVSQVLATATATAANGKELDHHLDRLRAMGGPARTDQIFQALGESLPGWSLDSPSCRRRAPAPTTARRPRPCAGWSRSRRTRAKPPAGTATSSTRPSARSARASSRAPSPCSTSRSSSRPSGRCRRRSSRPSATRATTTSTRSACASWPRRRASTSRWRA